MSLRNNNSVERREVLKGLAAAGGAIAVGTAVSARALTPSHEANNSAQEKPVQPSRVQETGLSEEARSFLGHIQPGAQIGRWTVSSVHDVRMGAVSVVLQTAEGHTFQVDVLKKDTGIGAPGSVADAGSVSVFVANAGNGSKATVEEHGLGAMALAKELELRIQRGAQPPRLLTLRERSVRFPNGWFSVA